MKLSDFDYCLPKELIAQYPLKERDQARLLVVNRKDKSIIHCSFKDIFRYLRQGDLLVLNDTKVLPSRIFGHRATGGKAELLLLGSKGDSGFNALIKPGRLKLGEKIFFNGGDVWAKVRSKNKVVFNIADTQRIYKLGVMPLPPYIKRPVEKEDEVYYQTVYARESGAVASPTAGLHFTQELLEKIRSLGVKTAFVTLHVGHGTFKPVKIDDITKHRMEREEFFIPKATFDSLRAAKEKKARIFAVGTTSARSLESAKDLITNSQFPIPNYRGFTDLFVYPGYKFKIIDCLMTNFHLPKTTLFMLSCAFGGERLIKEAYQEAIAEKYRFYSYGDAMLII